MYRHQQYSSNKNIIFPLDIILFRGTDGVSDLIRVVEQDVRGCGDFSHAGIIVTRELLPNLTKLEAKKLYVMESTMSYPLPLVSDGPPNILTGKGYFGVQIRDFEEVLTSYTKAKGALVAWVRLPNSPWDTQKRVDPEIVEKYLFRPYKENIFSILGSVFPCFRPARNTLDEIEVVGSRIIRLAPPEDVEAKTVFCSELLARIYRDLGMIPKSVVPEDVVPVDFLSQKWFKVASPVILFI